MNIKFQRAVDRLAGVPICAFLSLLDALFGKKVGALVPRRILVILLSEMGSLVLAQPMFARLKEKYPGAEIHVMLFAKNREVLDLLDVVPPANIITLNDRSLGAFVSDSLRAIARTRALKLDAVIDCELFSRVSSIFSYLSGARLRVGFHRHTQEGLYRGDFINRPVPYNPYRHLTLQFLTMVAALESSAYPLGKDAAPVTPQDPPHLRFADGELAAMAARVHADFPATTGKRLVLVYPSGGILPIRAWPFESYATLCAGLLAAGYAVGVIGLKDDRPLGQALVAHCASDLCIDLTGYTKSVRELLALFHRAALLITNDGGPGQFAALTPIPSIVFFGPETPQLYRSLSANAYCFHTPLSCSPCLTAYNHRLSSCDGDNQCLKQISPEQVLAKAQQMLASPDGQPVCA
ncbi:glycosyltransferase family 9 protein [Rhodocyclus tenuis]|uniref:Glycosyltransferase family 9 protein n=2 Tax=Rhodocyclus TaxID=1064 RepID=A0A6L5JXE6_RHOTE|nr:glycosyltransferase family 9 protein [Rhodocyclus gracilis]MQY51502.1 glycosyltransferase family 9 protein [Rhodocyclus gracilis]NJA89350.1 glycosyltransferase family 9 protein [Rhodocyclus gracilis]